MVKFIKRNVWGSLVALVLVVAGWGCKGSGDKKPADEPIKETQVEAISSCYAYQENGDTIQVQLTVDANGKVKGAMRYQLKEKDKNTGTLTGKKDGDTILADYQFQSEGMLSTRQVAFRQTDSTLTEGFGEVVVENDYQKFKDPTQLTFNQSMMLKKADCESLDLP